MTDVMHFIFSSKRIPAAVVAMLLLFCLFAAQRAQAITSTEVLPQGVRALGFVYANAPNVNSNFNANGSLEALTRPLNRTVTMDDLQGAEPRLRAFRSVLNAISPNNYGDQVLASNLFSDISIREKRYVAGLLWGISNQFSAGIIIPMIKREVNFGFRVDVVNNADQLNQIVGTQTPAVSEAFEKISAMRFDKEFFENKIFVENGYDVPKSYEASGLGDAELEARWKYFDRERFSLGARSTLRVPSATHKADLRNVLDRDFGERCYALRLASLHTWKIIPGRLNLQNGVFGTWKSPVRQTMAFAKNSEQNLPNLNDPYQVENVQKKLGSQLDIDTGFNVDFSQGVVSLFSSYQYTIKEKDRYIGERQLDYGKLEQNTSVQGHALESGVELSSVPLYLSKKWPIPGKLIATWYQPLRGKNNLYSPYGRFDAILFF